MSKVFISRKLITANRFQKILEGEGLLVEGWSLVTFGKIEAIEKFPSSDWIFFYSKNAIKYFFDQNKNSSKKDVKYACMGKGTEEFLSTYGKKSSFTGQGNSNKIITDFKNIVKGKSVLFPRALHSLKTIQIGLEGVCTVYDIPIYTNVPVENPAASEAEFLVFTSPMNVEVYLKNHKIKKSQTLIAIGKSTGRKLMHQTKRKVFVSPHPEEQSLAEFVLLVHALNKDDSRSN